MGFERPLPQPIRWVAGTDVPIWLPAEWANMRAILCMLRGRVHFPCSKPA